MEKTESFYFSQDIINGSPLRLEQPLKKDGRITKILCEFIAGENGDKKVKVRLLNRHNSQIPLINGVGNDSEWLRGNDTLVGLNVDVPFREESKIIVESENDEPLYDYPLRLWVEVTY